MVMLTIFGAGIHYRTPLWSFCSSGEQPVVNAELEAIVTITGTGIQSGTVLSPRDDGADPDLDQNDGVYSAYFTNFSDTGRYGVQVDTMK